MWSGRKLMGENLTPLRFPTKKVNIIVIKRKKERKKNNLKKKKK